VLHTEIFVPEQFAGTPLAWARSRERLWNTAEHAEKRHNSRVAREFLVTLPPELSALERVSLARGFSRELSERYRIAVDLAVHAPRPEGGPRNFHAHLLATTREITPAGLGAKAGLDMEARERRKRELPDHRQEYVNVRERWALLTNEALRAANIAARVDHRSLAAQGIDREPLPAIPLLHLRMEQQGVSSEVAEQLRRDYRERLERRAAAREPAVAVAPQDLEQVRRQARAAWLQLRSTQAAAPESGPREHAAMAAAIEAEDERAL
jgi:hypothetical protein